MASPIDLDLARKMLKELVEGRVESDLGAFEKRPESETNPFKERLIKAQRRQLKQCLAPVTPPCKRKPIQSHSIQRAGPIQMLADGTNHVMMFKSSLTFARPPLPKVKPVGVFEASTFPGLCDAHDAGIFGPIDAGSLVSPSEEQLFLLAYRSFLREFHAVLSRDLSSRDAAHQIAGAPGVLPEVAVATIGNAYVSHLRAAELGRLKRALDQLYYQAI